MAKLTKQRLKNVEQRKKHIARRQISLDSMSKEPLGFALVNPFENMTEEQINKLRSQIGPHNSNLYQVSLDSLLEIIQKYSPLPLLSVLPHYSSIMNNPDKNMELLQSHIELFQGLCLMLPFDKWGTDTPHPGVLLDVVKLLNDTTLSFSLSRMPENIEREIVNINIMQEMVRLHTQNVRNWCYQFQFLPIVSELYGCFEKDIKESNGFSLTELLSFFASFTKYMFQGKYDTQSFFYELVKTKDKNRMIEKYIDILKLDTNAINDIEKRTLLKKSNPELIFRFHYRYCLDYTRNCFLNVNTDSKILNIDEETCSNLFRYFSIEPGKISPPNRDYLFLDNPVWEKPLIRLDNNTYFCSMPEIFNNSVFSILDNLVMGHHKKALHKRRSDYLEDKIEEIAKRRFPETQVVPSFYWNEYQTDLLVVIDSYLLIIEAKSAKIKKASLRGASNSLKNDIEELIIGPSIQSKRLENRIKHLKDNPSIKDELRQKIPIDSINKIIRLSICLEDFAGIQTNPKFLDNTGWLPSDYSHCPTMQVADYEILFDLFEHPIQIIHYLDRRYKLVSELSTFGDEMDLLGLYIETNFSLDGLLKYENAQIPLSGLSEDIDCYYNTVEQDIDIEKPTAKISKLFRAILSKLEERSIPRWTEIGVMLLRFSYTDQEKLVKYINDIKENVNRNWQIKGHKNMVYASPSELSNFSLAYIMFKDNNSEREQDFIDHAVSVCFDSENIDDCLVITKNIDNNMPYSKIACFRK